VDLPRREATRLTLYEYVWFVKDKVEKPPEPKVVYQIPIGIAKRAMKLTISEDKSQTVTGHQPILLSQMTKIEPGICVQLRWHTFCQILWLFAYIDGILSMQ
jgi:hypothetical protein